LNTGKKKKIASLQAHGDLLKSRFLLSEAKCVWEPTQVITWRGAVLDTFTSDISATDKRITSLQEDVWHFLRLVIQFASLPLRKNRISWHLL